MKEYKAGFFAILKTLVLGVFGTGFAYLFTGLVSDDQMIAYVVAGAVALLFISLTISSARTYIRIENNEMYVKQGKKERRFNLNTTSFRVRTDNNGTRDLYAITEDEEYYIDGEFLGWNKFNDLIETIGVVGEKQQVIQIQTKKK